MRVNTRGYSLTVRTFILLCFAGTGYSSAPGADELRFDIDSNVNWRFVTIIARGNNKERKAHLTVYEVLRPDFRLRRFHDTELVNPYAPRGQYLSFEGRYFVTVNDWSLSKDPAHAIVIYDLMRGEHSVHQLGELFTDDEIENQGTSGRLEYGWHVGAGKNFDPEKQEFYVNSPDVYTERQGLPFIVVDLPSRAMRLEPKPIIGNKLDYKSDPRRWRGTLELKWQDGQVPAVLLPPELEYCDELDRRRKYKLDEGSREYTFVEPSAPNPK